MKVVCIKSEVPNYPWGIHKGKIYTISGITECKCKTVGLELEEKTTHLPCECIYCGEIGSLCYDETSFRPLQYESASSEIIEKFKLTEEKADVKIKETQLV